MLSLAPSDLKSKAFLLFSLLGQLRFETADRRAAKDAGEVQGAVE